jgi:hypothetical protein
MTAAAIYLNTDEIDWGRRVMLLQLVQEWWQRTNSRICTNRVKYRIASRAST